MKAPSTNRRRKRLAIDDSPEAVAARLRAASTQISTWTNGALKVKAPSEASFVVLAGPTRANPQWAGRKVTINGVEVLTLSSARKKALNVPAGVVKAKKSATQDATLKPRYKKASASISKIK